MANSNTNTPFKLKGSTWLNIVKVLVGLLGTTALSYGVYWITDQVETQSSEVQKEIAALPEKLYTRTEAKELEGDIEKNADDIAKVNQALSRATGHSI